MITVCNGPPIETLNNVYIYIYICLYISINHSVLEKRFGTKKQNVYSYMSLLFFNLSTLLWLSWDKHQNSSSSFPGPEADYRSGGPFRSLLVTFRELSDARDAGPEGDGRQRISSLFSEAKPWNLKVLGMTCFFGGEIPN